MVVTAFGTTSQQNASSFAFCIKEKGKENFWGMFPGVSSS